MFSGWACREEAGWVEQAWPLAACPVKLGWVASFTRFRPQTDHNLPLSYFLTSPNAETYGKVQMARPLPSVVSLSVSLRKGRPSCPS